MNTVDQQIFRDAMSCMGATVDIITTDGSAGRTGFTASAVYSVTGTPPTLLACLSHGVSIWPVFNENQTLCANILNAGQESLSDLFGGKAPTKHRFTAARWQTGATGCLQLEEALISFSYRINQVVSVGTHDILFCAIETIHRHATPYGLVWFDRSYHALIHSAC